MSDAPPAHPLAGVRDYMFDLDGCLWFGEVLAPDAAELIRDLRSGGARVGFLTNASVGSAAGLAGKLRRLGIPATAEDVVAPLDLAAAHEAVRPPARALVLGSAAVRDHLVERGVAVAEVAEETDVVVLAKDPDLTYARLAEATEALCRGAHLLALNLDARVPSSGGRTLPGVGAIAAALTTASGARPELVGKPSGAYFAHALAAFGMEAERTAMVGDTPETDVLGGRRAQIRTVLVAARARRGGDDDGPGASEDAKPDLWVSELSGLRRYLAGG